MNPAENYILTRPEPYKSLLLYLQHIIEKNYPDTTLKLKWGIPVYYIESTPFCYLNASLKKQFVDLAFWASACLTDYDAYLVSEGRKLVKSLRYKHIEDIDKTILLAVLNEVYKCKSKKNAN